MFLFHRSLPFPKNETIKNRHAPPAPPDLRLTGNKWLPQLLSPNTPSLYSQPFCRHQTHNRIITWSLQQPLVCLNIVLRLLTLHLLSNNVGISSRILFDHDASRIKSSIRPWRNIQPPTDVSQAQQHNAMTVLSVVCVSPWMFRPLSRLVHLSQLRGCCYSQVSFTHQKDLVLVVYVYYEINILYRILAAMFLNTRCDCSLCENLVIVKQSG